MGATCIPVFTSCMHCITLYGFRELSKLYSLYIRRFVLLFLMYLRTSCRIQEHKLTCISTCRQNKRFRSITYVCLYLNREPRTWVPYSPLICPLSMCTPGCLLCSLTSPCLPYTPHRTVETRAMPLIISIISVI